MTFKEAKKILKKEGYELEKVGRPFIPSIAVTAYESPEICEAMQVVCSAGYGISMVSSRFDDRKARLSLELAENSAPMPGPGKEQPEEKKGIIYPTTSPKADFYYKHVLDEGNPALKEAASQFNDALLDEQAKKIKRLGKEIARLNKVIHKKNEDLRLTKIREKNLAELGLKYVGENEKLKKELADKVVDKIDAQALKSAESALAWKEKTITYKDMALAYYEKKIAEKDEVIADLGNELAATKKELEEKTHLVDIIRNASKEYCDYGVAANEFIKELASLYVLVKNNGTINDEMLERCKNYQTYGFPANCNRETKKEINDIARGNENKKLSLFRDYSVGAVTNQKDCSSAKDTHPAVDIAEEGADRSGVIVLCGKDFVKKYKEIIEELSKVADDIIDQFLLFGEIIIKEEK